MVNITHKSAPKYPSSKQCRLSNLESENLELNQQVGELGRALGQEAAAYQAQVMVLVMSMEMVEVVT